MRALLLLSSFALAAATVWAQDADPAPEKPAAKSAPKSDAGADAWVKRLGHDEYDVREEATKKLIAMGAKAVPALEEALKSDDLEVRLRAGRALRAIRGDAERANGGRERVDENPGKRRGFRLPGDGDIHSRVHIETRDGKVRVKVTETKDGERVVKEYEGKSLEELKKKHPELRDKLGMSFSLRTGRRPFDMDRFLRDFWGDRDDLRKEMRATDQLIERMRRANAQAFNRWRQRGLVRPMNSMLGARVGAPSAVLNAQLGLRGRGLVVQMVEKGSLADRLGLEKYDILLSLNDKALRKPDEVFGILRGLQPGAELAARVIRSGEAKDLKTSR